MNALRLLRMMRLMMMLVTVLVMMLSQRASSSSSAVEANATRVHLSMPVTQADASVYLAARSSRSLLLVLPRCVQLLLPKANGTGSYSLRVAVTRSGASNVPEPDIGHPEVIPGYQRRASNGSATNATTYVVAALPLPGCVLRPEDWLLPVRASAINASRELQKGDVLGSDVVGGLTPEQIAAFTNLSRESGLGFDTVAAFFGAVDATANVAAASSLAEVAKRLGLTAEQVKVLSAGVAGAGGGAAGGGGAAVTSERTSRRSRARAERADGRQTVRDWPTPQVTAAPSPTREAVSFSATTTAAATTAAATTTTTAAATTTTSGGWTPLRLAGNNVASRAELLGDLAALLGDLQRLAATGGGNVTSERALPLLGRTSAMLNSLRALRGDGGGGGDGGGVGAAVRDDAAPPGAAEEEEEDEERLRNGTAALTRWFPVLADFARAANRVPTVTGEVTVTGGEAVASSPGGGSGSRPVAPLGDAVRLRWRAMVEPGQRASAAQPGDLFRLGAEDCVEKLKTNPDDVNCNPLLDPSAFYRVNVYVFLNDTAVAETGWSGPLQPHQKPSVMPASVPVFGGRSGGMVVITVILMVLLSLLLLVFIVSLVVKR